MQMSPIVRIICGVLGFGGISAIAFNAYVEGGLQFDLALSGSLLGGFLFLYAAFFGSLPWGTPGTRDGDKGKMSKTKWQLFWAMVIVFLVMATSFLSEKGIFEEASLVVLGIVGFLFALVGVAVYFYVRDRPDDFG